MTVLGHKQTFHFQITHASTTFDRRTLSHSAQREDQQKLSKK